MKLLKMKKSLLGLILVSLLVLPLFGFAQERVAPEVDVMLVLDRITDWLFTILLVIAAIFLIIAAFYFVTAAGSAEQVTKARNFVLYAIIGVIVAFLAKGLVLLVERAIMGW